MLAPAAIMGLAFLWMSDGPADVLLALDRFLLRIVNGALGVCAAGIDAVARLL